MKNLTIAGGVTRDAVLRRTGDGKAVLGFSVGVDDGFGQNKRSLYFDCSVWGPRAEKLEPLVTKGAKVTVSGELSTREHDGKTYLTIRVNDVTLQGGGQREDRQDSGRGFADQRHETSYRGQAPAGGGGFDDGDAIPFAPEWRA